MVEIKSTSDKVSIEEIQSFEKKIGLIFPKDYKDFLVKYNGGAPSPASFDFYDKSDASTIRSFFSIEKDNHNTESINWTLKLYNGRLPKYFLPVASDLGDNLILLDCSLENKGVFFWDHEEEADEDEEPTMDNMHYLSENFENFLFSLRDSLE